VIAREVAAQTTATEGEGTRGEAVVRGDGPRRSASDETFDTRLLRNVPRASAADYLTLAPGFLLSQHGGDGKAHQIFLRGFDAQHGQDVEFTVGGAPVNEVSNVHGQGYADLNFIIPEVVDRLRVLEGPYDPHQGDFAVAGSARFDLAAPQAGVMVRGAYGMFNTARVVAVLSPWNERRDTFLAGELARSDGYGVNRASSRAAAMGQYTREFGTNGTVRLLAYSYSARFDSPGVVREDDYQAGRVDFFGTYDRQQGGFSSRHGVVGEIAFGAPDDRTSFTAFGTLRDFRIRENFTGFAIDARGDRYEQTYDAGTVGLTASHRHRFRALGRVQAWEVGLSARHDITTQAMRRQRFNDGVTYATPVDADVNATDIGVFLDAELRLIPRVTLRGGVRADALAYLIDDRVPRSATLGAMEPRGRRDAQGFQVGPRATLDVYLGRGFSVLGSYGKGFRSPQALSLGEGENAPFATVHAGELGARFRAPWLTASVVTFVTHVDRDLVFEPTLGQNLVVEGSAATTRLGASALFQIKPLRGLEIDLSGTWARATFDATGLLVPYVPPLVGRADVAFNRPLATVRGHPLSVSAGLGASWIGARPLPFSETTPARFVLDAGASVRWRAFELGVSARNLTDARWRDGVFNYPSNFAQGTSGSRVPTEHFTAGRPFTLLGSVTLYL